MSMLAH